MLTSIKSTNYIENILEKQKASKNGYNDVVFFNEKGFVSETSCANIFIVKDNKIVTPHKNDGLLGGIIRNWILVNFDVCEKSITKEELENADEVFLTNSLMGIMSVNKLNNIKFRLRDKSEIITEAYEKVKK